MKIDDQETIDYLVRYMRPGSLVYLIQPLFWIVFQGHSLPLVMLSLLVVLLSLMRFQLTTQAWAQKLGGSRFFKWVQGVSLALSLTSGLLAGLGVTWFYSIHKLMFLTILIATLSSGAMLAFIPMRRFCLWVGLSCLVPFLLFVSWGLEYPINVWVLLGGVFYLYWNDFQVERFFKYLRANIEARKRNIFQEKMLRQFIDTLPGYVAIFDETLNCLDVNEKLSNILSAKRRDLVGRSLPSLEFFESLRDTMFTFKDSKDSVLVKEVTVEVNGQFLALLMSLVKYEKEAGEYNYSLLGIDITSVKQRELELEKQKLRLVQQERLAALGELAGTIAHEINNPLVIITGKADLLLSQQKMGLLNPEKLQRYAENIKATSQRIGRIVKSMRTLVREGRIEEISILPISEVIDPILELIHSRLDSFGVEFILDRTHFERKISCGVVEFGQVLMNLTINACHAIESEAKKWIKLEVHLQGTKARFLITDSGQGINEEVQKHLFERYFTTKKPGVGTGIGLSLSRDLMLKQDGNLYYDKDQPHTTFVIELPLAAQKNKAVG